MSRHVKNNDECRKYILRGQRNLRYPERIQSNKKKSYNFTLVLYKKAYDISRKGSDPNLTPIIRHQYNQLQIPNITNHAVLCENLF